MRASRSIVSKCRAYGNLVRRGGLVSGTAVHSRSLALRRGIKEGLKLIARIKWKIF